MQLGRKIRDLRLRRGLTVQQLGDRSGLSKGFISQVENGRTSPSLSTLQDLARALETSVAYLVVEEERAPHVVRAADRPQVRVGGNAARVELLSARPRRNLELLLAQLPPGLQAGHKRHYHHGEEIVVCLEGQVSLLYEGQSIPLDEGDSCQFDGRVPHGVENRGTTTARVLIGITPAAFEPLFRVREPHSARPSPAIEARPAAD